ncbi:MAG: hypothetical protein WBW33_08590, partial [Bryobacteraceae bacterium]
IHIYTELEQQIYEDLRAQHPEWIELTGECRKCNEHEARLRELLDALIRKGPTESPLLGAEIGDVDRQTESAASDEGEGSLRPHVRVTRHEAP